MKESKSQIMGELWYYKEGDQMKIKKIALVILLLGVLLLSGCNSASDFFAELSGKKPYISEIKSDKTFYTSNDAEIKILLKIKNPTNQDYSPKVGVDYPKGVSPVDYQLRTNKLMELVSINSKEEKSYFFVFRIENGIDSEALDFTFSIYDNKERIRFDQDPISVEFSSNTGR